jgi:cyclohexadienyl dehydratase
VAATMKDFEADNFDIAMGGISITLDRQKKGMFSTPIMREGKTPIARCSDKGKYETLAEIDKPGTRVIVNPGGTNERFAKAMSKTPRSKPTATMSRSSTRSPRAMPI